MRTGMTGLLLTAVATVAAAEEKPAPAPDPAVAKAVEAVEKASKNITSLQAEYTRRYTVFGRSGFLVDKGKFSWKRTPEGIVSARWDGTDEKGPFITLVRDRQMTLWRNKKKEAAVSLEEPGILHASRFHFPLIPRDWQTTYLVGGPQTSPEFDDRYPEKTKAGIPSCLTFSAKKPDQKLSFRMVTMAFDEETGLAYHFRCDTPGWTMVFVDLGDWTLNPKFEDSLFQPPVGDGSDPASGSKGGAGDPGAPRNGAGS
jgi:outer membrane lipoprotein-sorting protein